MSGWLAYTPRPYLCLGCGAVYAISGPLGERIDLFCRFCRHTAAHLRLR